MHTLKSFLLRPAMKWLLAVIVTAPSCFPETGAEAWLRYRDLKTSSLPDLVAVVGNGALVRNAGAELVRALGTKPKAQGPATHIPARNAFVLGTWNDLCPLFPELTSARIPAGDGFWI